MLGSIVRVDSKKENPPRSSVMRALVGKEADIAKDITIRFTGQNPYGTLNVQQLDGGNPFMSQQNTSMVPYNPSTGVGMQPAQQGGFRAKIIGVDVTFASEADYLNANRALH